MGRDDWKSEMYSNKLVHFECNSSKDDGISPPLLIFVRLIRMGGSGLGDYFGRMIGRNGLDRTEEKWKSK